jgi:hypothetical protein
MSVQGLGSNGLGSCMSWRRKPCASAYWCTDVPTSALQFKVAEAQVAVTTLRHRTLSPAVERFIECAREATKTIACMPKGNAGHAWKLNVS